MRNLISDKQDLFENKGFLFLVSKKEKKALKM